MHRQKFLLLLWPGICPLQFNIDPFCTSACGEISGIWFGVVTAMCDSAMPHFHAVSHVGLRMTDIVSVPSFRPIMPGGLARARWSRKRARMRQAGTTNHTLDNVGGDKPCDVMDWIHARHHQCSNKCLFHFPRWREMRTVSNAMLWVNLFTRCCLF